MILWLFLSVAATFIELHGPDGQIIYVNPHQIISIREPRGTDRGHWAPNTKCLVMTVDGKFLTTTDSCSDVRGKVEGMTGKSTY